MTLVDKPRPGLCSATAEERFKLVLRSDLVILCVLRRAYLLISLLTTLPSLYVTLRSDLEECKETWEATSRPYPTHE